MKILLKLALFLTILMFNQHIKPMFGDSGRFSPLFYPAPSELESDENIEEIVNWEINSFDELKDKFNLPKEKFKIFVKNILELSIEKEKKRLENKNLWYEYEYFNFDNDFHYMEKSEVDLNENYIVIGDLHGNFQDLEFILNDLMNTKVGVDDFECKIPILKRNLEFTPGYNLIVLGDFIDRGPNSLETILTLMILKLKNPNSVVLLRGNHEDKRSFWYYGFCDELIFRLDDLDLDFFEYINSKEGVYNLFHTYFILLPTAYYLKNKNGDYFQFNHAGWYSNGFKEQKDFFDSDKLFFKIYQNIATNLKWNDLEISENEYSQFNSQRGEGLISSTQKAFNEMGLLKIIAKFGGHQHNLLGQNKNPDDFSNGFCCIKDDNSLKKIFLLISASIYPLKFGYKYYPTYLLLSIEKYFWNCFVYSKTTEGLFDLVFFD
jgi:hypothetical protein